MFKVPFRMIYCDTIGSWIKETIWCFVVIKIWRNAVDLQPYSHIEGKPDLCPWCANIMPVGNEDPRIDMVKA
jgi:hypothetical protein